MDRLNVLMVQPSLPYPPHWAAGIRRYQLVRHLATKHAVTLIAPAGAADGDNVRALESLGITVRPVRRPGMSAGPGKRLAQLAALLSPAPFAVQSVSTRAMQRVIDRELLAQRVDLVVVQGGHLTGLTFSTKPIVVLDEHNIEYELLRRSAAVERSPWRKLFNWVEYVKFRRTEVAAWKRIDACIFHSERELAIFRERVPDTPALVLPNGISSDLLQPAPERVDPNMVVFTGAMDYRPNADSVGFFVREVLPLIVRHRPQTVFFVVGRGATAEVRSLAGPNVVITDWVPDVRPYLARASVVVVPTRFGSGTRYKILEALAAGRPMVSTSLGCEGYPVRPERELLVADQPADFAAAVLRLLEDRQLAEELAARGRALVQREYLWGPLLARLDEFLAELTDRRAGLPTPMGVATSGATS